MTEVEINTYLDDFETFEKVCKQREIKVYPDKEEYVAMYSQEDVLALWAVYCFIQSKERKEQ